MLISSSYLLPAPIDGVTGVPFRYFGKDYLSSRHSRPDGDTMIHTPYRAIDTGLEGHLPNWILVRGGRSARRYPPPAENI